MKTRKGTYGLISTIIQNEMEKIQHIDKNMSENVVNSGNGVCWYKPDQKPMRLTGFAFYEEDKVYRRLPLRTKELFHKVNPCLNDLCENTAGGQISFRTDSTRILLRAKLTGVHNMSNMTAVGQFGFDCYLGQNGERLKFYGITRFDITKDEYECEMVANLAKDQIRDVLIHFPLYGGIKEVEIGLDEDAVVQEPKAYEKPGKIVFYGTSITQGGCASRPGMAYTNILSRWLNYECINFGFSANGLGEPEMADRIAEIEDVSMVVLDYEANAGTNGKLELTLVEFIHIIRRKHPFVPILVLSRIPYTGDYYNKALMERRNGLRDFQRQVVMDKKKSGDNNIYFYNGNDLMDEYFDEYTVDFIHPTDLGFFKMAEKLFPLLKEILS